MPKLTTETDPRSDEKARRQEDVLLLALAQHPSSDVAGRETAPAGKVLLLGRAEDAAFAGALDLPRISRRHAELRSDGDRLTVRDLGSRNGTFVNRRRVTEAVVGPGDVLRVGDVLLVVDRGPALFDDPPSATMIGTSFRLAGLKRQIALAAKSPVACVVGETGAGKELVARALHDASGRRGPFVAMNCGAIAEGVLHSELFGHTSGAFSGAQGAREGLVAAAQHGTLFLDEIGAASAAFQSSLLRLIEGGEYRPVGSNQPKRAEVAFVGALQPGIDAMIEAGSFRRDLWNRLARWPLTVPSLRERREDIPLLARHFASREAGRAVGISAELAEVLLCRPWPGNVRELRATIERAVAEQAPVDRLRLTATMEAELATSDLETPPSTRDDTDARRKSPAPRPSKAELAAALQRANGNVTVVASDHGVPRKTVYRWMKALGIEAER